MRRGLVGILIVILLAGCVGPAPFASPVTAPAPFASPLQPARPQMGGRSGLRIHIPLVQFQQTPRSPKKGVTLACSCATGQCRQEEVDTLNVSWVLQWGTHPQRFPGVESIPMIWDARSIGKPLGGNSQWLLGFNEPDLWDQANMTPEEGARQWARLEAAYPNRKLASPQVMLIEARWLERFYAAYQAQNGGRAPRLDAIAIHTYVRGDLAGFKREVQYYSDLAKRWGVPEVWVTEFGLGPNRVEDTRAYVTWLEAQPLVTRYAIWTNRYECAQETFGTQSFWGIPEFFNTPLYTPDGVLTPLGAMYRDVGLR